MRSESEEKWEIKHRIIFKDEYEKPFLCVVYIINSPQRSKEKKKVQKSVHYDLSSSALSVWQKLVHLYVFTIQMCVREAFLYFLFSQLHINL